MSPTSKAALWMIGAILSFSMMAVAGRAASGLHDTFEIMLYRSIVGVAIMGAIIAYGNHWSKIKTKRLPLHITRNLAHFIGQNLWFWALPLIPLAQLIALEFTSPVWVILLAPLLLGERLSGIGVISAIIGFIGVLIVARPDMNSINPGIIAAASSAVAFALTAIMTRNLTRTEHIVTIMFYLTLIQLIFGLIAAGYDGQMTLPTGATTPPLIAVGCAGLLAHFCLTKALSLAPAAIVMPIDFGRLPTMAVIGMLLYNEPLDLLVFVGAALIFGANYINILSETRKTPA